MESTRIDPGRGAVVAGHQPAQAQRRARRPRRGPSPAPPGAGAPVRGASAPRAGPAWRRSSSGRMGSHRASSGGQVLPRTRSRPPRAFRAAAVRPSRAASQRRITCSTRVSPVTLTGAAHAQVVRRSGARPRRCRRRCGRSGRRGRGTCRGPAGAGARCPAAGNRPAAPPAPPAPGGQDLVGPAVELDEDQGAGPPGLHQPGHGARVVERQVVVHVGAGSAVGVRVARGREVGDHDRAAADPAPGAR